VLCYNSFIRCDYLAYPLKEETRKMVWVGMHVYTGPETQTVAQGENHVR